LKDYIFILGSNWLVSIAELLVYLRDHDMKAGVKDFSRKAVIVSIADDLDERQTVEIQSTLGGCFKTGRVVATYNCSVAKAAFPTSGKIIQKDRKRLLSCPWLPEVWKAAKDQRIRFGVSTYPMWKDTSIDMKRFTIAMDEEVKERLTELGARKVDYFVYEGPDRRKADRPNTALWPQTLVRHGLLTTPNAEILAVFTEGSLYLGRTVAACDSTLQQHRDESRPYVSAEISTSPKICRTLLNLAGAKASDTVLDPFCGTGTILMEAALLGMTCVGIDIDANAVQGSKANMTWLESELGRKLKFEIIRGDARDAATLVQGKVDAAAFEPYLGPVQSNQPEKREAEKAVRELTRLYHDSLSSIDSCLKRNGRVGMSLPVMNSKDGIVRVNLEDLLNKTGFAVVPLLPRDSIMNDALLDEKGGIKTDRPRLPERKRGQIVQRELIMLSK
jgi:predicted RNA methylase